MASISFQRLPKIFSKNMTAADGGSSAKKLWCLEIVGKIPHGVFAAEERSVARLRVTDEPPRL
jgi:hypothetical protein